MEPLLVAALYKFAAFPEYEEWQLPLKALCLENDVKGTLLLASEGINGTIAGPENGVRNVVERLQSDERFADLNLKWSHASSPPFLRMKVRCKREIVTMGVDAIDPNQIVGTYVKPRDWNAVLADPDVVVIDTRNDYEVGIGTFQGAVNPGLGSFREFPEWLRKRFESDAKPKVAMFCTGGIRCEKSTAFLKREGISEVFHLEGGILKYLEDVPAEESLWQGECFVFDERVSVCHGLEEGTYELCRACRNPIDAADMRTPEYEVGVSCPHCFGQSTAEQKIRYGERARQIELATQRGERHLGHDPKRDA
ncbi:UNVERIFIED_CONTAM: hypothetical protein GTU68_058523 [Idotea baltica]|nr:hypothetical protein [Idotea baltica]